MRRHATGTDRRRLAVAAAILAAAVACGGAAAPAGATSAPVGEWRFDEAGGQAAVDSGARGLDGRLGAGDFADSADPERIAGAAGRALRFDGTSYVRLPARPELDVQQLTAEAVVRAPASPGAHRYVISRGSRGCYAGSYGLYTAAAGGIALYVFDGSRYVVSATARPADVWDGRWHHVAGTFDGVALRLYLDGRLVGEPTTAPMRIDYAGTSTGAFIGRFVGDCDLAYRGDLDLARLWPGALSAGQVAAQAQAELAGASLGAGTSVPAAAPGTSIPGPRTDGTAAGSCVLGSPARMSRPRAAPWCGSACARRAAPSGRA
jgi:Concanavalin A-like lectin/glucanases superfamily